jgi:hypothetical protein
LTPPYFAPDELARGPQDFMGPYPRGILDYIAIQNTPQDDARATAGQGTRGLLDYMRQRAAVPTGSQHYSNTRAYGPPEAMPEATRQRDQHMRDLAEGFAGGGVMKLSKALNFASRMSRAAEQGYDLSRRYFRSHLAIRRKACRRTGRAARARPTAIATANGRRRPSPITS